MRQGIIALACLAAFPWTTGALAQSAAPVPAQPPVATMPVTAPVTASTQPSSAALTLLEAYRLAVQQDALIRTARAGADARRERLPQARAQLLPNIYAQAAQNRNDLVRTQPGPTGRPLDTEQFYESHSRALVIRQPLFRPALIADYRQARAQVADANATLEKEVQNLANRVTSSYMEALLSEDTLALVMQQKTTYATQLDAAKKRFAGGAGVRTDIDEAQARMDLAAAHELEARQNVEYTRRALQVIINVPVTRLAPIDEDKLRRASEPGTLDDWRERAELNSPELLSLKAQREAARYEYDKARAGHLPTLDAIAQWSISKSDTITNVDSRFNNKSIGVQLTVPLFSGGLVSSQARQSLAEIERTEGALEATRRDLALRVEKEYRGVTEGTLSIRALETAARSAAVMVTSNRRSLEGGARTLVDVMNAEETRLQALRDLANARYLYALSRIRLKALAGAADEEAIAEVNGWLKP